MKKSKDFIRTAFMLLLLVNCFSCGIPEELDGIEDALNNAKKEFIFEIDKSVDLIHNDAVNFDQTLEELGSSIDSRIASTLSFDIPFIINTTVGELQNGGQCLIDAMADKAIFMLLILKSELITGEPVPLPSPHICITSHNYIDLGGPIDQRKVISFYGYNLYSRLNDMTAYLIHENGMKIPVEVGQSTDYSMEVNLSTFPDEQLTDFNRVSLRFDGDEVSSIFILDATQMPPPLPEWKEELPTEFGYHPPTIPNVDKDLKFGKDTDVHVSVIFGHNRTQAYVQIAMVADENRPSHDRKDSTVAGTSEKFIYYTAPPGRHIDRFDENAIVAYYNLVNFKDRDNSENIFNTILGQVTVNAKGGNAGSSVYAKVNFSYAPPIYLGYGD